MKKISTITGSFRVVARSLVSLALLACLGGILAGTGTSASAQETAVTAPSPGDEARTATAGRLNLVSIGAYLNDVQAIDLSNHNYMVDFYLWFRWTNADIDPSSTVEFVNHSESWGTIITKSYENPVELPDGQLYQVMHVQGRMSRKFDLRKYPFDRQCILIEIEDSQLDAKALKYVVDGISANPELKLPGFQFKVPTMQVRDYSHPTNFGDVRIVNSDAYSRVAIEMRITRPAINSFIKNILPVLLISICCSFVFLLHPSLVDSRFQIAIFSIFSIIALQITAGDSLPPIEYLSLLDTLYLLAYAYCIAVVGLLVYVTKLSGDETRMAEAIRADQWGGGVLVGLYLVASGVVALSAFTS